MKTVEEIEKILKDNYKLVLKEMLYCLKYYTYSRRRQIKKIKSGEDLLKHPELLPTVLPFVYLNITPAEWAMYVGNIFKTVFKEDNPFEEFEVKNEQK